MEKYVLNGTESFDSKKELIDYARENGISVESVKRIILDCGSNEDGIAIYPSADETETKTTTTKPDVPAPSGPAKKLKMGKLIILAAKPKTLFAKVRVSISGAEVEKITEKGKYAISIEKDCTVDMKWNQAFSSKSVEAKSNEIKIVKLTWGLFNINLDEIVYAKDGVKLFNEEEGKDNSSLKTGMKVAGLAIGVAAALLGGDDAFGADFDDDLDFDGDDLDLDGDGITDAVGIDMDGDGVYDEILVDKSGDGIVDTVLTDADGDGTIDTMLQDTDGDGVIDIIGQDTDGDGRIDSVAMDMDGDGNLDTVAFDTNGDGDFDVAGVDTNKDGKIDSVTNL